MDIVNEGITRRTGWFGTEFIPFDEVQSLEASTVRLRSGDRVTLGGGRVEDVRRALSSPVATGRAKADADALVHYVGGAWSPARAATALLEMASAARASDVHLETEPDGVVVRFRKLGVLAPFVTLPRVHGERLIAAFKQVSGCLPYRKDLAQEGRIERAGVAADVRTAFLPTALGERAALRLFGQLLPLDRLGFDESLLSSFRRALGVKHGLVLVAGASGAGKTTTIYAALAHVAQQRGGAHLSLEDPVEQRLRLAGIPVAQVELSPERGLTGEAALVAALRQDLDVLAVGEIRTEAEARLAVRAAHTGRLVLAGLHAGSAEEAEQRLLELGAEPAVLAKTLVATLHQSLGSSPCDCSERADCARCGGLGRVAVARGELRFASEGQPS